MSRPDAYIHAITKRLVIALSGSIVLAKKQRRGGRVHPGQAHFCAYHFSGEPLRADDTGK